MIRSSEPPDSADPAGPLAGSALRRLVEAMPKAELHLHLDGSLRVETALDLARTRGTSTRRATSGRMFEALVAPPPCASQAELLRAFDLPIALMQDAEALERVTAELVETKAADGVRYVEIRWGPVLHVSAAGCRWPTGSRRSVAAPRDGGRRTGDDGPPDLHRAARARPGGERRRSPRPRPASATQGLTGWDLAGPEAAYPDPLAFARGVRGGPRRRPADHPPRRRVGRRRPGPAGARARSGADRPRPGRGRRPGAVAELIAPAA